VILNHNLNYYKGGRMAIIPELKTQYLLYYRDLSDAMTDSTSIYQKMITKMTEQFNEWGITEEEKAKLVAQTVMTLIPQFEQLAETSARELMTLESEIPIKDNQAGEIIRKTQYYDDRLLETVVEKQADLASFAVNANSDSAQTTINDLKVKMSAIEQRVVPVLGNECPTPNPIISIPNGLNVSATSDTVLTISWLAVPSATLYALYRDGVQIASTGSLNIIDSGLIQLTKYSYNVKAFSGSLYSDLSLTVVGTTLATPVIP
jgi:hypothetical protein